MQETALPGVSGRRGFTLIELGVVLVIVGLIVSLGAAGWWTFAEARRIAITQGEMRRAKNCLIQRIIYQRVYPAFSAAGGYSEHEAFSVDRCLFDKLDGWGHTIYFMQGRADNGGAGLDEDFCLFVNETSTDSNDPCSSSHASNPPVAPDASSTVVDEEGNTIEDVAFVLISFGSDGLADNSSYDSFAAANAVVMPAGVDFSDASLPVGSADDDLFMIVTFNDLLAEIAKARQ